MVGVNEQSGHGRRLNARPSRVEVLSKAISRQQAIVLRRAQGAGLVRWQIPFGLRFRFGEAGGAQRFVGPAIERRLGIADERGDFFAA